MMLAEQPFSFSPQIGSMWKGLQMQIIALSPDL